MTKSTSDSSMKSKKGGKRSILEASAQAMSEQGKSPSQLLGKRRLTECSCEKSLYDASLLPTPDLDYEMQVRHNRENTWTSSDGHMMNNSLPPPPRPHLDNQSSSQSLQEMIDTVPELLFSTRRPSTLSSNPSHYGSHPSRPQTGNHGRNTSDHWQT